MYIIPDLQGTSLVSRASPDTVLAYTVFNHHTQNRRERPSYMCSNSACKLRDQTVSQQQMNSTITTHAHAHE